MSNCDVRIVVKAKAKVSAIKPGGSLEMEKIKAWVEERLDESFLFEYCIVTEIMELTPKKTVKA